MKNIFAKFQEYVKKPKRNVFDLQFRNNLTTKFGQLTPVFCKEVVPGDSFKIDTKFGLMLMPMKFPVQTPMKAYVHYFYVRNRTLWKDWMDFIGGTKEGLVQPYVQPIDKHKFFRIGGLADYLGVPNVLYSTSESIGEADVDLTGYNSPTGEVTGDNAPEKVYYLDTGIVNASNPTAMVHNWKDVVLGTLIPGVKVEAPDPLSPAYGSAVKNFDNAGSPSLDLLPTQSDLWLDMMNKEIDDYIVSFEEGGYSSDNASVMSSIVSANDGNFCPVLRLCQLNSPQAIAKQISLEYKIYCTTDGYVNGNTFTGNLPVYLGGSRNPGSGTTNPYTSNTSSWPANPGQLPESTIKRLYLIYSYQGVISSVQTVDIQLDLSYETAASSVVYYKFSGVADLPTFELESVTDRIDVCMHAPMRFGFCTRDALAKSSLWSKIDDFSLSINLTDPSGLTDVSALDDLPYDSDIHLNALPFRAYEAIYNSYYRNPQNNPFVLDGVPEYNRYNTTYEGGADTTQYDLYFRNWEYDFLTSAVQSPQQGVAPLVGVSVTGEATFADEEGNTYYAQALMNDEGEITGWQSHSSNMPVGSLRLLMDMANTGISINDLRNVNAFQRFLENNIRHGLKYKDQLMSHFGVKARYDELDMPEFIGGCSAEMEVYKVTQTSNSGDTPLGSFVGQAQVKKDYGHSVTHYCDEHGFIMGIMSIVPVPVYSQLLPKFFVKNTQLDYFFPEFGHIGYQPILQKEVSPLQTYYSGLDLNKVFGYNRAWYDYLASTDEVHAQFRTTMRDFIMNRSFSSEPELGEDFLLVDPEQLNDVFLAGTEGDDLYAPEADKIIGSLLFNVSAKRPIPLFGIPKLDA